MEKYNLCEYLEFGAISWIILHMCDTYNCDYLQHSKFCFNLIDF